MAGNKGKNDKRKKNALIKPSSSSQASSSTNAWTIYPEMIENIASDGSNLLELIEACSKRAKKLNELYLMIFENEGDAALKIVNTYRLNYNYFLFLDHVLIQIIYSMIHLLKLKESDSDTSKKSIELSIDYLDQFGLKRNLKFKTEDTEALSKVFSTYIKNRVEVLQYRNGLETEYPNEFNGNQPNELTESKINTFSNFFRALTDAYSLSKTPIEILPNLLRTVDEGAISRAKLITLHDTMNSMIINTDPRLFESMGIYLNRNKEGTGKTILNSIIKKTTDEITAFLEQNFPKEENSEEQDNFITALLSDLIKLGNYDRLETDTIKKSIHLLNLVISKIKVENKLYFSVSLLMLNLNYVLNKRLLIQKDTKIYNKNEIENSIDNQLSILRNIINDVIRLSKNENGPKLELNVFLVRYTHLLTDIDRMIYSLYRLSEHCFVTHYPKGNTDNSKIMNILESIETTAFTFQDAITKCEVPSDTVHTYISAIQSTHLFKTHNVTIYQTEKNLFKEIKSSIETLLKNIENILILPNPLLDHHELNENTEDSSSPTKPGEAILFYKDLLYLAERTTFLMKDNSSDQNVLEELELCFNHAKHAYNELYEINRTNGNIKAAKNILLILQNSINTYITHHNYESNKLTTENDKDTASRFSTVIITTIKTALQEQKDNSYLKTIFEKKPGNQDSLFNEMTTGYNRVSNLPFIVRHQSEIASYLETNLMLLDNICLRSKDNTELSLLFEIDPKALNTLVTEIEKHFRLYLETQKLQLINSSDKVPFVDVDSYAKILRQGINHQINKQYSLFNCAEVLIHYGYFTIAERILALYENSLEVIESFDKEKVIFDILSKSTHSRVSGIPNNPKRKLQETKIFLGDILKNIHDAETESKGLEANLDTTQSINKTSDNAPSLAISIKNQINALDMEDLKKPFIKKNEKTPYLFLIELTNMALGSPNLGNAKLLLTKWEEINKTLHQIDDESLKAVKSNTTSVITKLSIIVKTEEKALIDYLLSEEKLENKNNKKTRNKTSGNTPSSTAKSTSATTTAQPANTNKTAATATTTRKLLTTTTTTTTAAPTTTTAAPQTTTTTTTTTTAPQTTTTTTAAPTTSTTTTTKVQVDQNAKQKSTTDTKASKKVPAPTTNTPKAQSAKKGPTTTTVAPTTTAITTAPTTTSSTTASTTTSSTTAPKTTSSTTASTTKDTTTTAVKSTLKLTLRQATEDLIAALGELNIGESKSSETIQKSSISIPDIIDSKDEPLKNFIVPNIEIYIPYYIKDVMREISNRGYQVKILGGYVRDKVFSELYKIEISKSNLDKKSLHCNDVDLITDCPIEELDEIFSLKNNSESTNSNSETIYTGKISSIETLYRLTCDPSRYYPVDINTIHGTNMTFEDKLKSSDLTVNALLCNAKGELIDPHNYFNDFKRDPLSGRVVLKTVDGSHSKYLKNDLLFARFLRQHIRLLNSGVPLASDEPERLRYFSDPDIGYNKGIIQPRSCEKFFVYVQWIKALFGHDFAEDMFEHLIKNSILGNLYHTNSDNRDMPANNINAFYATNLTMANHIKSIISGRCKDKRPIESLILAMLILPQAIQNKEKFDSTGSPSFHTFFERWENENPIPYVHAQNKDHNLVTRETDNLGKTKPDIFDAIKKHTLRDLESLVKVFKKLSQPEALTPRAEKGQGEDHIVKTNHGKINLLLRKQDKRSQPDILTDTPKKTYIPQNSVFNMIYGCKVGINNLQLDPSTHVNRDDNYDSDEDSYGEDRTFSHG